MANKGDKDDQNAASNSSGRSAPPKGNVTTVNQPKVREQTELGKYPKRRSRDEY